jgi:hypothetical protein
MARWHGDSADVATYTDTHARARKPKNEERSKDMGICQCHTMCR